MTATQPGLSVAALRRAVARHAAPVMVTTLAATNILRIFSNLILTRLLAPEAFGIIGVLTSVTFVLQMVTDMGYHAFVVRSREADQRHFLNVVWTIRLFRSVVLTALMFSCAGLLADAFNKPELTTPIRAASFLFLFEGLRSLYFYTAERARRASYVTVVEFAIFILQTIITIAAAFVIQSFWAIVIGMYAAAILNAIFSYTLFEGGLHKIAFDKRIGGELWAFARIVVASSIITIILGQADKVFVGRSLTLELFGLYMLAVNITGAALRLINVYVARLVFPTLAETQRTAPETLRKVYYACRRRMTIGLAFLLGGGIGGGHLLVRILFDERYLGSGIFVSLLSIPPLFILLTHPAENLLVVLGRIKSGLEANIVRLAWIAIAAPLAFYLYGLMGLVTAFATIEVAAVCYWWWRVGKTGYLDWREEALPLAAAALGGAIGFAADRLVSFLIAANALPAF
jgi:O-antigen/teichoic acid export membrane protein